jgi:uncharacterized membrane protein YqgA involved in biofilm formation
MRRLLDLILIVLILGVAVGGAYEIGRRVDRLSNSEAAKDADLSKPITTSSGKHGPSAHTIYWIAGGAAAGVAVIVLGSLVGSFRQSRRRERWRAT